MDQSSVISVNNAIKKDSWHVGKNDSYTSQLATLWKALMYNLNHFRSAGELVLFHLHHGSFSQKIRFKAFSWISCSPSYFFPVLLWETEIILDAIIMNSPIHRVLLNSFILSQQILLTKLSHRQMTWQCHCKNWQNFH